MPPVESIPQSLLAGEKLSREEFLHRWEALPHIKKAELIGGVVYLPSPVSNAHCEQDVIVALWLGYYASFTPGCKAGGGGTWLMLSDAPQPDVALRILPEYGGQSQLEGPYCEGAPELAAEICLSSTSYDLGPKLKLYRRAGVREYVTVLINEGKVIWRRLIGGKYASLEPDADGVLRSKVFPGLWLDPIALLNRDGARVLEVVNQGLKSPEHHHFVQELASRKK